MKVERSNILKLELEGDEIARLKDAIKSVCDELKRPGYLNSVIPTEMAETLNKLNKDLK